MIAATDSTLRSIKLVRGKRKCTSPRRLPALRLTDCTGLFSHADSDCLTPDAAVGGFSEADGKRLVAEYHEWREASRCDREEARAQLAWLHEGKLLELRTFGPRGKGTSGYYSDVEEALDAADRAGFSGQGVYVTLNEVAPDIADRKADGGSTTDSPEDVSRRRWLFVDVDPWRPSGTCATTEEKGHAEAIAVSVREYLKAEGWGEPRIVDSGNGFHLFYRIDLPNDDESRRLCELCLLALDERFSNEHAKVDKVVFNASRLIRLAGTMNRKGENTPERPHRRAKCIHTPENQEVIDCARLEALAATYQPETTQETGQEPSTPVSPAGTSERACTGPRWTEEQIRDILSPLGLETCKDEPHAGGHRWVFETCPACRSEKDKGTCCVYLTKDGVVTAKCQRESCDLKKWEDFGTHTGAKLPRRGNETPLSPPRQKGLRIMRFDEVKPRDVEWLWPSRIPLGMVSHVFGPADVGKTTVMLDVSARVTKGRDWPDKTHGCSGRVLYISSEDTAQVLQARLEVAGAELDKVAFLAGEDDDVSCHTLNLARDVELLDEYVASVPDCRLVVFDPVSACLGGVDSHKNASVRELLQPLSSLAAKHHIAVVMMDHVSKRETTSAMDKANGSGAFVNAARSSIIFGRHPNEPELRIMARAKCNLAREVGGMVYELREAPARKQPLVEWHDVIEMTGDELLRQYQGVRSTGKGRRPAAREKAKEVLAPALEKHDGELPSAVMRELAKMAGVSKDTAQRALEDMGYSYDKDGYQGTGVWRKETPATSPQ